MLVVALDALLHGFSREVLDFGEYLGQCRRKCGGVVRGHGLWSHSCVLESGTKESRRGFGVSALSKQDLDDLPLFIEGALDVSPAPRHFLIRFVHRPAAADMVSYG